MSNDKTKPRLRFFENAAGQQHIPEKDKYLYAVTPPTKLKPSNSQNEFHISLGQKLMSIA